MRRDIDLKLATTFFLSRLQAMNADPYRGPWGGKACRDCLTQVERHCDCPEGGECEAASRYAEQLEEVLRLTCSYKRVAAFFTESIQVGIASSLYSRLTKLFQHCHLDLHDVPIGFIMVEAKGPKALSVHGPSLLQSW